MTNRPVRTFSRRALLIAALAVPPLGLLGYIGARTYPSLIMRAVRSSLSYLDLDAEGLQQFAADFAREFDKDSIRTIGISFALGLERLGLTNFFLHDRLREFEHFAGKVYLMSSDFFQNGADEQRTIRYVGLYDPYVRPCTNPFAQFE